MMEFQKIRALNANNLLNIGANQIIKILLLLQSAHMLCEDQNKVVFYLNNNINLD